MGVPLYPPHFALPLFEPFYRHLAEGELWLTVDPRDGSWLWYPPEAVPGAPEVSPEWRRASDVGTIYSHTTIVRSLLPRDHSAEVPFTVVLFEPEDAAGSRVAGLWLGDEPPACDARARFEPIRAGDWTLPGFRSL